jgi:hypothetical protein
VALPESGESVAAQEDNGETSRRIQGSWPGIPCRACNTRSAPHRLSPGQGWDYRDTTQIGAVWSRNLVHNVIEKDAEARRGHDAGKETLIRDRPVTLHGWQYVGVAVHSDGPESATRRFPRKPHGSAFLLSALRSRLHGRASDRGERRIESVP